MVVDRITLVDVYSTSLLEYLYRTMSCVVFGLNLIRLFYLLIFRMIGLVLLVVLLGLLVIVTGVCLIVAKIFL